MIDFHSHVLPHIDDGAKDADMAVKMLEESKRQGVKTVICTPHYYGKKRSPRQFVEKRAAIASSLLSRVPEGIELRFGAEVYFTADTITTFEELALLCIENTRYVMLELPFTPKYDERLFQKIEAFMSETDCIPLIAHVDRYPAVQKKPAILTRLAAMGCLFQVNAEAFHVKGVQGLAYALLKKGMVHAVGSDMHNMEDRAPNLQSFLEVLQDMPMEVQECLRQAQADILENRLIIPKVQTVKKLFGKYF
jgi:protein-tyrosine phosphatase